MKVSSSAPRDCAGIAPDLTALFDGEADDVQARAARAHLLSCSSCSRLWLDWSRHRETLQNTPVPAPPPTLLWRVLIAYRVAAFARPARRRSRLPQVSARPLRGLEAPLPPRLSDHILARTTRKPNAHVLLTPLQGAPASARTGWKARATTFRRAPYLAVPALALMLLMLGRTQFDAISPTPTPDTAIVVAPATALQAAPFAPTVVAPVAPVDLIPVAPLPRQPGRRAVGAPIPTDIARLARAKSPTISASVGANSEAAAPRLRRVRAAQTPVAQTPVAQTPVAQTPVAQTPVAQTPVAQIRVAEARVDEAQTGDGLGRVLVLAINSGRRDAARVPRVPAAPRASAARASVPVAAPVRLAIAPTNGSPRLKAAPRAVQAERATPAARVELAALASPISPIRTLSAARLRTAAFSEDSTRPRVTGASASGRRLARVFPDESATTLRVSRPNAGAPTLREVASDNADKGPRLEDLRSAVDDFRASVAGDEG